MSFKAPIKPLALAIAAASSQAYGVCTSDFSVADDTEFGNALSTIASDSCGDTYTITIQDSVSETLYLDQDLSIAADTVNIIGPSDGDVLIAFSDDESSFYSIGLEENAHLNISNATLDGQSDSESARASEGLDVDGSTLHLENVITQNFYGSSKGFIYAANGNISLTDSTFEGNHGGSNSGGNGVMYAEDSTITITDSTFINNSAADDGGAINVYGASSMTLTGSTFTNNTSARGGGALAIGDNGSAEITDTVFNTNASQNSGGAIYAGSDSTLTINDSTFTGNEVLVAGAHGGAIYVEEAGISITNSTFSDNHTLIGQSGKGGAIQLLNEGDNDITSTISQSSFTGNQGYYGGAISVESSGGNNTNQLIISDSVFTENTASNNETGYGGVISIKLNDNDAYTTTVQRSLFDSNNARSNGGAIYLSGQDNDDLIISNSTISNNESLGNAGIVFAGGHGSESKIEHSTIVNNTSTSSYGSAILGNGVTSSAALVISHTIISGNTGGENQVCNLSEGSYNFSFENSFISSDPSAVTTNCLANDADAESQIGTSAAPLEPLLNDLADNGGFTQSFYPQANSPVIDAGDVNFTSDGTDQRGAQRILNSVVDIGATEFSATAPELSNLVETSLNFDKGENISLDISSYFNSTDGSNLTYSATNLPTGLTLDSGTGILSGTLTTGTFELTFTALSAHGLDLDTQVTISITDSNDGSSGGPLSPWFILFTSLLTILRVKRKY